VVDMSVEFQRHGKKTVVSETLATELHERLSRGEQAMILLNRRAIPEPFSAAAAVMSSAAPSAVYP